jgi:anthranilate phosphoribosyltransferase
MLKACIEKLIAGVELDVAQIAMAMDELLVANNAEQCAAFLALLRQKGETALDISTAVHCLRENMKHLSVELPVLDIVGTGGDGFNTVNISTASALLAASCGITVLKHGNRSVSSACGSADLMEAFGYHLELGDEQLKDSLSRLNFGFCYAPAFHPAFAAIKPIRKRLGIPTLFNLVGPLLNPAQAGYLLMGVGDPKYLPIMAQALQNLGVKHALVFNGCGLDEVSTVGPVDMIEIKGNASQAYTFNPAEYGFSQAQITDLRGGDATKNKAIIADALQGKQSAVADTLVLNAGLACYVYGVANSVEAGIALAKENQKSGSAYDLLLAVVAQSQEGSHA